MKLLKTAKKITAGAVRTFAALSLVFCVNGTLQLCLCDSDPDGCGEHCHECVPENQDDCVHVTVQLDAPLAPQTSLDAPQVVAALPASVDFTVSPEGFLSSPDPAATGPPHPGGLYISSSTRLYPLS